MKYLIFSLLIAGKLFAASGSGNVSSVASMCSPPTNSTGSYTSNGQQTVPLSALGSTITLVGHSASSTGGGYYAFYSMNQASGSGTNKYQVPAGKTLFVTGLAFTAGSAGKAINVGWGTAAVGSEGGTAPAGENSYAPSTTNYPLLNMVASTTGYTYYPMMMSFPASDYPFWKADSSSVSYYVYMCGYVY